MPQMSDADIDRIAKRTAEHLEKTHLCRLKPEERKMIHGFNETMVQEKADMGTFRALMQVGVAYQSTLKRLTLLGVSVLVIIALSAAGVKGLSWIEKLIN